VVICAYNVAPYIRESVSSALQQTYQDIEVIVLDDGSTDGTTDQLEGIDDPRLRVIKKPHKGHAPALNAAIALTRGSYIGLLDADDRWLPKKLEIHLAHHAEHPTIDMTYSMSEEIDVNGVCRGLISSEVGRFVSFRDLLIENVVRNGSASVLRKEALIEAGPFDEGLAACQDVDMWLRIARFRERSIYALPYVLTQYRRRPRQLTANVSRIRESWLSIIRKVAVTAPREVAATETNRTSIMNRYFAYLLYEARQFGDALGFLWRGFLVSPGHFLGDSRNLLLTGGCLAGIVLPPFWHAGLHQSMRDRYDRAARRRLGVG